MAESSKATSTERKLRRTAPKTKTGCFTCRRRRVKCDEGKPTCERCRKYGAVTCDGYLIPSNSNLDKTYTPQPIVAKLWPEFQKILWEPSSALFTNERDYSYFRSFCEKTAHQLDGFVPTDLWSRLMIQACERSSSLRHGIVAIAALDLTSSAYRGRGNRYQQRPSSSDADCHHEFALQQYGLAIRHMQDAFGSGDQDVATLLMTCLIIICFETFHGNTRSAINQLRIATNIIEDVAGVKETKQGGLCSNLLSSIDKELLHAFIRLDTQGSYIQDTESAFRKKFGTIDLADMPARFVDLKEAGHYRDLLHMQCMHYINIVPKGCQINMHESNSLVEEDNYFLAISQRWQDAFQPLLANTSTGNPNFLAAKTLELHSLAIRFMCESILVRTKPDSKDNMPTFRKMVALARHILGDPNDSGNQGIFTLFPQIIIPLYLVGYSCPHGPTRREAIQMLLLSGRREGFWDAMLVGKVVEWRMGAEEEIAAGEWIEEDMQMLKLTMECDLMVRGATVKGLMPQRGSTEVRILEAELTW